MAFRQAYAIDATRLYQTRPWVVSFSILSAFRARSRLDTYHAQVLRLKGSDNLDYIQLLKKPGGQLGDSYLAEGFVLDKKIGIGQPKRLEKAKVMVANTAMDTDKIKIYGARVKVDSLSKVAAIEQAEKDKMVWRGVL